MQFRISRVWLAGYSQWSAWERMIEYPLPPSMPHTFRLRLWFWLWFYHWFWFWFWFWLWLWFCLWLRGRLRGHLYFLYYLLLYSYTTCSESPGERVNGSRRNEKGKYVFQVSRCETRRFMTGQFGGTATRWC